MAGVHASSVENLLTSLEKQRPFLETGFTTTINVATDLSETPDNNTHIGNLERYTVTYAQLERDVDGLNSALKKIRTLVAKRSREDEIPNLPGLLEQYMDEAAAKANRKDVNSHPRCVEFRKKVYGDTGQQCQASAGQGDEDEDLIVASVEVSMTCPITQQPFVEPVFNDACKHTYSKKAILAHLEKKHGRVRCPVLGCVQTVTKDGLQPDHAVQGKLRRQKHALPK